MDREGQSCYARLLEFGRGVKKNLSQAERYYRLSADQRNSVGHRHMTAALNSARGLPLI
jgi:TPR repeat protein